MNNPKFKILEFVFYKDHLSSDEKMVQITGLKLRNGDWLYTWGTQDSWAGERWFRNTPALKDKLSSEEK